MNRVEYLAGFFDGEGCIDFNRNGSHYRLRIQVVNCTKEPLDLLKSFFGGTIYQVERTNCKLIYRWVLNKKTLVKPFLEELLPHLIVKRRLAILSLQYLSEGLADQNQYYREFQALNHEQTIHRQHNAEGF